MSLREEGQEIARKLGGEVIYKGPWLPNGEKGEFLGHWFTDRVTGSSFAAKTLEQAKAILIQSRKDWGEKPPVFANNPGKMMLKEREISPLWIIPVSIILGIGAGLGLILAVARAAAERQVTVALKNPPAGSKGWNLYLYGANGGPIRMHENLAIDELAIWDDITEEEFPFQVTIDVWSEPVGIENVLHHAQSRFPNYMNYYPNLLIYSQGTYNYNCATVEFE